MIVLIIEDDSDLRDIFKEKFERRGLIVFTAENGQVGLDILANEVIDLVLTDIQMPIMTGMDFLKFAKNLPIELPPIIVMTGGSPFTSEQIFDAGATAYFNKLDVTAEKIISVCSKKAA